MIWYKTRHFFISRLHDLYPTSLHCVIIRRQKQINNIAAARFSSRREDEIAVLRTELNAKTNIKANKRAATTFWSYLSEKNQPTDFENFDKIRLNEALAHFYIHLRKTDGDKCIVNSLENIRHSLSRYLQAPPFLKTFDLVKGEDFREANVNFRAVLA